MVIEERNRLVHNVALIIVRSSVGERIAFSPHISRNFLIPSLIHTDIRIIKTNLITNSLIFNRVFSRILIDNLLNKVVHHGFILYIMLLWFNNWFDYIISLWRRFCHIFYFFHIWFKIAFTNVFFQVFVSFTSSEILTTNDTKYLILYYCCITKKICLFVVEVGIVVKSRFLRSWNVVNWVTSEWRSDNLRSWHSWRKTSDYWTWNRCSYWYISNWRNMSGITWLLRRNPRLIERLRWNWCSRWSWRDVPLLNRWRWWIVVYLMWRWWSTNSVGSIVLEGYRLFHCSYILYNWTNSRSK